jgi:tripartite-type tricarboxylate transporter receptor subunit TctC
MMSSPVAAGQAGSTRLKMLAVASKHRLSLLPKVPTMAEAGVPGVDQTSWQAVFLAPGVPAPIRERIARAVFAVVSDPAIQGRLRLTGFEPLPLDGVATQAMYRDEIVRWTQLVKERGLGPKSK